MRMFTRAAAIPATRSPVPAATKPSVVCVADAFFVAQRTCAVEYHCYYDQDHFWVGGSLSGRRRSRSIGSASDAARVRHN